MKNTGIGDQIPSIFVCVHKHSIRHKEGKKISYETVTCKSAGNL